MRKIFALADTHLGAAVGKTMDRFGPQWIGHQEKIAENAWRVVGEDDVLLLPGDLSWATKRADALPDLAFLASLPGIKIAIKGNHDYWWESRKSLDFPGLLAPPVVLWNGAVGVAGTRGWFTPEAGAQDERADHKILERERRLLASGLAAIAHCETRLAMTHYPPQPYLADLASAGVAVCAYGHVHVASLPDDEKLAFDGEIVDGVRLFCVACDRIDFTPRLIWEGAA